MDNHGIELSVGSTKKFNNGLQVSLDGNFTYAMNKVIQMYETAVTRNDPRRSRTGRPYNTVFGYHALGLFTTADDKTAMVLLLLQMAITSLSLVRYDPVISSMPILAAPMECQTEKLIL